MPKIKFPSRLWLVISNILENLNFNFKFKNWVRDRNNWFTDLWSWVINWSIILGCSTAGEGGCWGHFEACSGKKIKVGLTDAERNDPLNIPFKKMTMISVSEQPKVCILFQRKNWLKQYIKRTLLNWWSGMVCPCCTNLNKKHNTTWACLSLCKEFQWNSKEKQLSYSGIYNQVKLMQQYSPY